MQEETPMVIFTMRVPVELRKRLIDAAKVTRRKPTDLARILLEDGIKAIEDAQKKGE